MTPTPAFTDIFNSITNISAGVSVFWNVIAVMLMVGFFVYALFSLVIVRQVFQMSSTFKTSAGLILKIFSFLHFFFALSMILLAYLTLF